jgi:hypothetical protein
MSRQHIEVILAHDHVPTTLRDAIRQTGAWASFRPLTQVVRDGVSGGADAVVIVIPPHLQPVQRSIQVVLDRMAERPRAVLLLGTEGGPVPPVSHPTTVPVISGGPLDTDELAGRLTIMLEMTGSLESLHRGMLANRRTEQHAAQLYERQLKLAQQIQREFIPETLPQFGPVSFRTLFRPTEYVSGDMYDIHRLDEEHVAVALADATGHGLPAALLTVFIKRALRGKEIHNGGYRILTPGEVLAALNDEILEANLSECRFVAAIYAVLNTRTLQLSLARGGAPYPILRRADGSLQVLRSPGGLIGVMPGAVYPIQTIQLQAGDSLVLFSDGVEAITALESPAHAAAQAFAGIAAAAGIAGDWEAEVDEAVLAGAGRGLPTFAELGARADSATGIATAVQDPPVAPSSSRSRRPARYAQLRETLPPDEAILASGWCDTLQDYGPAAALDQLAIRHQTLRRLGHTLDDLTVLTVEIAG